MADAKATVSPPANRDFAAKYFRDKLGANVLNAGVSTVRILDAYMSVIDIFKAVDPSGVILSNVADSIKVYLHGRPDTVVIIVKSLLEGPFDETGRARPSTEGFSARIAACMEREEYKSYKKDYYEGSDLENLEWTPEPVDAIPGTSSRRLSLPPPHC